MVSLKSTKLMEEVPGIFLCLFGACTCYTGPFPIQKYAKIFQNNDRITYIFQVSETSHHGRQTPCQGPQCP